MTKIERKMEIVRAFFKSEGVRNYVFDGNVHDMIRNICDEFIEYMLTEQLDAREFCYDLYEGNNDMWIMALPLVEFGDSEDCLFLRLESIDFINKKFDFRFKVDKLQDFEKIELPYSSFIFK